MTRFEAQYFSKFDFSRSQVNRLLHNALRDLEIAEENKRPEVKFSYSYSAFMKAGITLLAKYGVRVRSVPGHHVKIIDKISELLRNGSLRDVGHIMRQKRNMDLYDGGVFVSKKEAGDFYRFVKKVVFKVKNLL